MKTNMNNFFLERAPFSDSKKPQNFSWLFCDFPYDLTNFKDIEYEIEIKNGEKIKLDAKCPKHEIKIGSANIIFELLSNKCYIYPSNPSDFVGIFSPSTFEVSNNEIILAGNYMIQFELSPDKEGFYYWQIDDLSKNLQTFKKPKNAKYKNLNFIENLFELHNTFDQSKQLVIEKKEKKFILKCTLNYVYVFFQSGGKRKLINSKSNKILIGKEIHEYNLIKRKI